MATDVNGLRIDSYADWAAASGNQVPQDGEFVFVTDHNQIVEGDGSDIDTSTNLGGFLPPGIILPYGGSSAPTGFLSCDGSAVSRTTYARLFAAISTTWGVGDGSTTFNLPDLRETVPVGTGTRGSGVTAHDTFDVGEFKDDQGQGHYHDIYRRANSGSSQTISFTTATVESVISTFVGAIEARDPTADGTNGTPRTGTTTRTKQAGVLYVIKI